MAFDRKRNQLYNLEAKGGDRGVIDKTRSTLTKLENRLEVALKAIELASLRIQRLTNEELYPQLAELVGGYVTLISQEISKKCIKIAHFFLIH